MKPQDFLRAAKDAAAGAAQRALRSAATDPNTGNLSAAQAKAALVAAIRALMPSEEAHEGDLQAVERVLHLSGSVVSVGSSLPYPVPTWCAWLIWCGVLKLLREPVLRGGRVHQLARLSTAGGEFTVRFCAPVGHVSNERYLAIFPAVTSRWTGPVCLRVAAERGAVRLTTPAGPRSRESITASVSTLVFRPARDFGWFAAHDVPSRTRRAFLGTRIPLPPAPVGLGGNWPRGWPLFVSVQAGDSTSASGQGLFDLRRIHAAPGEVPAEIRSSAIPLNRTFAFDFGTTRTAVASEQRGDPEAVGPAYEFDLGGQRTAPLPSGWVLLAGPRDTAHRYGCGEHLAMTAGYLPTALDFSADVDLVQLSQADDGLLQGWLPQTGPARAKRDVPKRGASTHRTADEEETALELPRAELLSDARRTIRVRRFKSPELVDVPGLSPERRAQIAARLLGGYAQHVGLALSATYVKTTPRGTPRLGEAGLVVTYPGQLWAGPVSKEGPHYRDVMAWVAKQHLAPALEAAWATVPKPRMFEEIHAVRSRGHQLRAHLDDPAAPVDVVVDFGGMTLDVDVRVHPLQGRFRPRLTGSSMSYRLGGELFVDGAAVALCPRDHQTFEAEGRRLREAIDANGSWSRWGSLHRPVCDAILRRVVSLVARQVEGTLRLADPFGHRYLAQPIDMYLFGDAWLLTAMDVENGARLQAARARVQRALVAELPWRAPGHGGAGIASQTHVGLASPVDQLRVEMLSKRELCTGALGLRAADVREARATDLELLGVDVLDRRGAPLRRWFGPIPEDVDGSSIEPDTRDAWWRAYTQDRGKSSAHLPRGQWNITPQLVDDRFPLTHLRYNPKRSPLEQWVAVCGPARVALDVADSLRSRRVLASTNIEGGPRPCSAPKKPADSRDAEPIERAQ